MPHFLTAFAPVRDWMLSIDNETTARVTAAGIAVVFKTLQKKRGCRRSRKSHNNSHYSISQKSTRHDPTRLLPADGQIRPLDEHPPLRTALHDK